jgi:hypothetical protein
MPIIPALCRPKQKVHQFMASLGYITRSCPKRKEQNKTIGKKYKMKEEEERRE